LHPGGLSDATRTQLEDLGRFTTQKPAGCLHTSTVESIGRIPGEDPTFTPLVARTHWTSFSFNLTGGRGAALATPYEKSSSDIPDEFEHEFKELIKRGYSDWRKAHRSNDPNYEIRPVLITGFDATDHFAMVSYCNQPHPRSYIGAIPMFGSHPPADFYGEWNHGFQRPNFNLGVPPAPNQYYVFIRYYTMRFKDLLLRKVDVKFGGGGQPIDSGLGDNQGGWTPPGPAAKHDAQPTTGGSGNAGGQRGSVTKDADSGSKNTPQDQEYDRWDVIADYIFQNSDATSALMHHFDVAWLHETYAHAFLKRRDHTYPIRAMLARVRPQVIVDELKVGTIVRARS